VTGLALLYDNIFVRGAQYLQKVCRTAAKAFGENVQSKSK
jgi:hypothetical protein